MKAPLEDEPAKLLAHLPTTSANYEVTVRFLKQRYANKRMISFAHMDAIFEFRPIQQESAEQLRKLLNVFLENAMALDSMGVETSDSIWVYTIAKKLDPRNTAILRALQFWRRAADHGANEDVSGRTNSCS